MLPAVTHVWNSLEKPRGARCALMAKRVSKTGTGRRGLVQFIKRFLEESLYELDVPDLPVREHFQSFEDWNRACLAMFEKVETDLAAIIERYASILGGEEPATPSPPSKKGRLIKGPWGKTKPVRG